MRLFLLVLALGACRSSQPAPTSSPTAPKTSGKIQTWQDVELFAGQSVTLVGRFDHFRGQHGIVVLDSELRIMIPHFDLFKRNDDWLRYVGRRVQVSGRLHAYTKDIPGYQGPSMEITHFSGPLP